MTQKTPGLIRLEIADGRAGEEADARQAREMRRYREFLREILDQRMHQKVRQVAAQLRQILLQKVARNIDRNIGLDGRRGAEQDTRLAARPAAEFDQRAAGRKHRGDGRRVILQDADFAARRIIFRQLRDALEQRGALQIVKIFRRQTFSASRSARR